MKIITNANMGEDSVCITMSQDELHILAVACNLGLKTDEITPEGVLLAQQVLRTQVADKE